MIGIDVGGANLKVVDAEGAHVHPCPLWKKAPLQEILGKYRSEPAAVVMTGELADCFSSKMEGIRWIVSTVKQVFPQALFYGIDGSFHRDAVPQLAAANWLASAEFLLPRYPGALLLDMGSTTTDLIPLHDLNQLKGLSDLRRLQKGYLVYHGLLRTSIPAFVQTLQVNGLSTPLSSEYFAITADVHLLLGHISTEEYTCETPDGTPPSRESSLRRIARLVCADPVEVGGENGVQQMAEQICSLELQRIQEAIRRVEKTSGTTGIVCAGIGGRIFAPRVGGLDLARELGPAADTLPALAVREVAERIAG
ncbi:MAG: H4MPT-linked C1 transfer pathway protein [Methanomicrobiales archaeon]|nr:H4MPT-linked C1 transfer pathway protein [Methanomicrobiales archaeon]